MSSYYNEIDPYAAQWLRNLIEAGHIAYGVVDERSIEDIHPNELIEFTQCHFFAGVGVWSLALRRAGWSDDREVWTGSCPCQPFSAAGKGAGVADERHLWPAFFHLITQRQPARIYGEQVASKDGLGWLDLVQTDLEGAGYASGAVDLCAAGVGAPHIRQRLWFVAERLADHPGEQCPRQMQEPGEQSSAGRKGKPAGGCCDTGGLADPDQERQQGQRRGGAAQDQGATERSQIGGLGDTDSTGPQPGQQAATAAGYGGAVISDGGGVRPGPTNGPWRDADWLHCRDGKWRPVEPGTFPLAHGSPNRVGRLRAYGNAINAQAAQAFIEATI